MTHNDSHCIQKSFNYPPTTKTHRLLPGLGRVLAMLIIFSALTLSISPEVWGSDSPNLAFVRVPVSAQPLGGGIHNTILSGRYFQGMQIILTTTENKDAGRQVAKEFFCATDPAFSLDGTRLLFSGKRSAEDPLQIWELSLNSPVPHQVFAGDQDCIRPQYLPNGHIIFASLLSREYEEHGGQYSLSLYEWVPGNGTPNRLSFNPSSDFDPAILPDGRIVFSSWQHVGNHFWPRGNIALNLTNWDGTGLFPLTGNHRGPWLKRGATPLGDGRIAFILADDFSQHGAGGLVVTDLNDAFAPYQSLIASWTYQVTDAALLANGNLLVSARPATKSGQSFGLYIQSGDKPSGTDGTLKPFRDNPEFHELSPAVYVPDYQPDTRFSTVVPDTPFGYVLILNCFETDRLDTPRLNDASVQTIRVIEGMPLQHDKNQKPEFISVEGREDEPLVGSHSATGYIPSRILGEVTPASDGSVYLKVPADRPLRLQLVDPDGFAVVNERSWFWVRPNERRTCIGCHENRELSPHNITPKAASRAATDLTDPAQWKTVTFRNDIQPIMEKSCALSDCHIPPRPTAGMNLEPSLLNPRKDAVLADRFGPAYANLLMRQEGKPFAVGGRRIHPGDSRGSPLLWMLYGRVLGPQFSQAPFERAIDSAGHPGPMLPEEQLSMIRKWVDLGAIYENWARSAPWPSEKVASWSRSQRDER